MTTDAEAIHSDASFSADTEVSPGQEFLNRLSDRQNGVSNVEDEDEPVANEVEHDEGEAEDRESVSDDSNEGDDSETEHGDDTDETPAKRTLADDDTFTHLVDGEEVTFSIADAKRELGRKKAFQRKEQEVADLRKKAEEAISLAEADLTRNYEFARKAYSQYEGVNLQVVAMREGWDADTLEAVMEQEKTAWSNLSHYETALRQHVERRRADDAARIDRDARECMAELMDPNQGIQNFTLDHYNGLINYAVSDLGLDHAFVANLTNAKVIKALDKLYRLDRGQKIGKQALETKTSKAAPAPTKVLKATSQNRSQGSQDAHTRAMNNLKKDSSSENIQAAFLARISRGR